MTVKKIEYSMVNSFLLNNFFPPNTQIIPYHFLLDIANKATYIIHHALKIKNRNSFHFTNSTKTKSEVEGGGRKPWKQKGTGKARSGSNRSPLWRGGGVSFGPKPRIIYKKINKKEKQLALRTMIFNKSSQFIIFDNFLFFNFKTIFLKKIVDISNKQERILFILARPNKNLQFSIQNYKNIQLILANQLNLSELIKTNKIILDKLSFDLISRLYNAEF